MIQAALGGDFTPFEEILEVVRRPFDEQPEMRDMLTRHARTNASYRRSAVHETLVMAV